MHVLRSVQFVFAFLSAAATAGAQVSPLPAGPQPTLSPAAAQQQAQALFDSYVSRFAGRREGGNLLIRAGAYGLPQTPRNTTALRRIVAGNTEQEEKVIAIRLLAAQYAKANPTGMNHLILADLKQQAISGLPRVAAIAIFAYSRLGYLPDSLAVLRAGRGRAVLDDDSYFGEIAHMLPGAPPSEQLEMSRMLRQSRNGYASDIAAGLVTADAPRSLLTQETTQELRRFLEESEPRFSITASRYDRLEATRYQYWLRAIAQLREGGFNRNGAELVLQRLSDPMLDTRKLYAFFTAPYAPEVLGHIPQRERYTAIMQRMASYPGQFPDEPGMADVAAEARSILMEHTR